MNNKRLPNSVAWLSYGGLVPFLFFAGLSLTEPAHQMIYRRALLSYGAVILSFVGAIHWGFAMIAPELTDSQRRSGFVPALMAWFTVFLGPVTSALILILGFLVQYWRDVALRSQMNLPIWFLPLRMRLTSVACISLALGAYSVF
ncbi:MAG: hypothetical protein EoVTN8_665 [Fluviibacter phosphoraccumulans EoVTN8]